MKPAFALDFRDNAVSLHHRSGAGWHQVGSVPVDEPDLPAAIGYLRSTALGLSPQGVATKLVIPNDQILYLTVHAPGPDATSRRSQIEAALVGRTPYAVEDLVYDWAGKGSEVQVAVIARETLAEAEGFAAEHRFNPLAFVAVPDDGVFAGEPWFGPTELSTSLLAPGEKLERDKQPISLRGRPLPSATEPVAEALPEPAPVIAETRVAAEAPAAEPAQVPEPETDFEPEADIFMSEEPDLAAEIAPVAAAEPAVEVPEVDATPAASTIAPAPSADADIPADPDPVDEPEETAAVDEPEDLPPSAIEPEDIGFDAPLFAPRAADPEHVEIAKAKPAPQPTPEPEDLLRADPDLNPPTEEPIEEAPMALDVPHEDLRDDAPVPQTAKPEAPKPVSVTATAIADDVPAMPAWTPAMAFASRRSSEAAGNGKPLPPVPGGKPTLRAPVERPTSAKPLAANAATARVDKTPPAKEGKGLRGIGAFVSGGDSAGGKKRKSAPPPAPTPTTRATVAPIAKSTMPAQPARPGSFGLGARAAPQRGKPKYLGLILTAILLIFLAVVAAWSTFLASWDGAPTTIETADAPPPDSGADVPAPEDEMLADMQDPADYAASDEGVDGDTLPDAPAETLPDAAAAPLPEAAPETVVTTEGVTPGAPGDEAQDEIFLATMDSPPDAPDPLALPQSTAQGDPLPDQQAAPPPFGTVYQFDAQGLIVPTPEGIVTPDGVRIVAGKPPVDPPARPAELTAAAAPLAAEAVTEAATEAPFPSDPALAEARPKARPEGLAPPASATPDDDASLAPAADSRFASLRPRARPEAVVAAGEAARAASAGASLAETVVAENAVATAADASLSPLAVAISRKPAARPADMSRAVEAAVAAATREAPPAPEPEPEPAAKPASGKKSAAVDDQLADDEPEHTSAAPSIPTKASVAKQATYKNAINLSKLNLIGVYGTQSNRYALIRQENGRYKKVKVGDKIDGGKVAAITATELRYQKGSRMITLAMPAG